MCSVFHNGRESMFMFMFVFVLIFEDCITLFKTRIDKVVALGFM